MNVAAAPSPDHRTAPSRLRLVLNVIAFQFGWFACVLGAAYDRPWLGSAVVAVLVAVHLATAIRPALEARLVAAALVIGVVWETLLLACGWIEYPTGVLWAGVAPLWIVMLWALFAITLNSSLGWLKGRLLVAAVFGAVGGPLAYWGGVRLGALVFVEPLFAVIALAVGWAVLTPLLVVLAQRFERHAAKVEA